MRVHTKFILFIIILLSSSYGASAQSTVEKEKKVYIRNIVIKGNDITSEFVVRREMNLNTGDEIPEADLLNVVEDNRQRILNCQLFVTTSVSIINRKNDSLDVEYTVKELFYWNAHPFVGLADRNFNVWFYDYNHKLNRLNIGADINRKNFRGRREEIGIEGQVGFNKHLYLYYTNPYIDKTLKNGIRAVLSYNTGKEIQAITDSNKQVFYRDEMRNPYEWWRAEFSYLYRPGYATIHELRLGFNHYNISQQLFEMQPNFLSGRRSLSIPEIMYKFRFNNTNDRNYPTNGWMIESFVEQKGLGLLKDFSQMQLYAHVARFVPIRKNLSASAHFRGRVFGPDKQPYFNYRAMGYKSDYVRGYEYYIVDGSHYALLRADLRQRVFHYNFRQNIFPIFKLVPVDLYAKIYNDMGYVYSNNFGNSFLNNKFLNGYGLGVDVVFSYYVKLRLEYSFNGLNEKGLFLNLRNE